MLKQYIETGRIVGTHGIRGEMRLEVWADSPEFLKGIKQLYLSSNGEGCLKLTAARPHKNICILKAKDIDTIEEAEKYRGKVVYINRNDKPLEKGRYYIQDLLGCAVFHAETGNKLGEISDVTQTGANDVWHIKSGENEYLIPVIPDVVKSVDVEKEEVKIVPLRGIFEDED